LCLRKIVNRNKSLENKGELGMGVGRGKGEGFSSDIFSKV